MQIRRHRAARAERPGGGGAVWPGPAPAPGHLHKRIGMCLYNAVSAQTKGFEAAGELLKVLAAPARLAIVTELAEQPRFVHELVARLGMSQPLISQHLRVLRGARLVGVERRGREAAYSLVDQHVAHIVADAVHHSKEGR
jgi:ArsR family transcriptional regulator, zinc-responsive transcriptional repressor